jgi:hypothetical protein
VLRRLPGVIDRTTLASTSKHVIMANMSDELKAGQRFRVAARYRIAGYQPGDKGTVLRSSISAATGERYYTVEMDKDGPDATGVLFTEGEIEADV